MTPEAALTKLSYVLGNYSYFCMGVAIVVQCIVSGNKDLTYDDRKAILLDNIRGERVVSNVSWVNMSIVIDTKILESRKVLF